MLSKKMQSERDEGKKIRSTKWKPEENPDWQIFFQCCNRNVETNNWKTFDMHSAAFLVENKESQLPTEKSLLPCCAPIK